MPKQPKKQTKQPPTSPPPSSQAEVEDEDEDEEAPPKVDDEYVQFHAALKVQVVKGIKKKEAGIIREARVQGEELFKRFTHAVEVTHHAQLTTAHQTHLTRLNANQAKYQALLEEFITENKAANICQNKAVEALREFERLVDAGVGFRATCENAVKRRIEMNEIIKRVAEGGRKRPRKSDDTLVASDEEM